MPNLLPTITQVGDRKYGFRSDHLCILVLPCPQILLQCASDCLSMASLLLKLSGDVEENPGPVTDEILAQILQTQNDILKRITEIQEKQNSSEANCLIVQNRLSEIEKKLECVDETSNRLARLESAFTGRDDEMYNLSRQVDDLENRGRKNNLIIRGIQEEPLESEDTLAKIVVDHVFGAKLNVKIDSIERIHRIGRKFPRGNRPVIVKLADFRDKVTILKNCVKLKGTAYSINEDFSKRINEIRKNLWSSATEEKRQGSKVKLIYDKLKVNDTMYAWDENRKARYPVSPGASSLGEANSN